MMTSTSHETILCRVLHKAIHSYKCTESHMTHMVRSSYYKDFFWSPTLCLYSTLGSHDCHMIKWQWLSLERNLAYPCFTCDSNYTFQITSKMVCKKSMINSWCEKLKKNPVSNPVKQMTIYTRLLLITHKQIYTPYNGNIIDFFILKISVYQFSLLNGNKGDLWCELRSLHWCKVIFLSQYFFYSVHWLAISFTN